MGDASFTDGTLTMCARVSVKYIRRAPSKLANVGLLLSQWHGEEDELLQQVYAKYVTPSSSLSTSG